MFVLCDKCALGSHDHEAAEYQAVLPEFEAATGLSVPHRFGERRPGDVTAIYADAKKAENLLGWRTKRPLEECLADAWRWQEKLA